MIGQTISHYKILSKLGEGGMGVVYKAEDLKLKRTVALKFLPPELTRDEKAKTRFIHEAQAASALQHHNICAIHEIDETSEGQLFICMDCYEGETLKDKIGRAPLPLEEAIELAIQVGEGLLEAHEAGIVHRDVKPGNVIVTEKGVVKILDFGLAKLAGQTKMTKTGVTVGTVSYMSPEQARGEEVDHRSDIWSLGVVFYEMVTGKVPFPGDHEAAVWYGILHGEPKALAAYDKGIPERVQAIIDRALKKDPKERYPSVFELLEDLDALSDRVGGGEKKRRRRPHRVGSVRRARRRRLMIAAAAVVGIVVVAGLILGPRLWRLAPVTPEHALAVMDFRDLATPEDPTVSAGMTELVNIGLIQSSPARVISTEYLHDLSRRLFGVVRGPIEESQAIEVARKADATFFLVGLIGKTGESRFVTWRLVDAKTGKNVEAGRVEGNVLTHLADGIIRDVLPLVTTACGVEAPEAPTAVANITTESPRAYQHYMAALLADEEGRRGDALAELEKAVAQDSTFALAYLELARLEGSLAPGTRELARAHAEKALGLKSRLGVKDQLRLEAQRLILKYGRTAGIEEGIATLRNICERWPDDRQTLVDLVGALLDWWNFAEALQVAEEGQRLYPDEIVFSGPAYLFALAALGRNDQALRATQTYVRRFPKQPNAWHELGWRYLALGLPDSAETAFQKAAELDPDWVPENSCYCAYRRGDLKGAIACFEKILEQKNLSAEIRFGLIMVCHTSLNLGALYVEAGRYQKMHDVCAEYLELPKLDQPGFRLLVQTGRPQEVVDLYWRWTTHRREKYIQSMLPDSVRLPPADSTMGPYPRPLGQALAMLGDGKNARRAAKRLFEKESTVGGMARYDAIEVEARAALADHDPKNTLALLYTLEQYGVPRNGFIELDYRTLLAAAYRMDGRLDEAVRVHRELLRVFGGHALSHYELGTLYEEMKRPAEAKKEYEKFVEMWSEADEGLPQLVDARQRLARLQEIPGL